MSEKQSGISVAEKMALVQNNLRVLGQQEYDLSINVRVNEIAEDKESVERLKAALAKVLKKKDAFLKILDELGGENGNP